MPPKRLPFAASRRPTLHPSLYSRLRAWWAGVDNADLLMRCGERGLFRSVWTEWRTTLVLLGSAGAFLVSRNQLAAANEALENIELNRQNHYKKQFAPTYTASAPTAVYDGPRGYSYIDTESGLMINSENRLASSLSAEDRRARLANVDITEEMILEAENLLRSPRYQRPPHPSKERQSKR